MSTQASQDPGQQPTATVPTGSRTEPGGVSPVTPARATAGRGPATARAGSSTGPELRRPTVGDLVAKVSDQLARIVRAEVELIQVKLTDKLKNVGVGAGFFAVAGLLALYALGVLIAAAVLGLAVVLPAWLSALIIGVVLLIIAGILALIGKNKAQRGEMPSPDETKANLKADVDAVKKGVQS